MKHLSPTAAATFRKAIAGVTSWTDGAKKIGEDGSPIMPLVVEAIEQSPHGRMFSLAHYYEQNGDLMRDPEVTFYVSHNSSRIYPFSILNDGIGMYEEPAWWADGVVHCDNPKKQADIAAFCETWMANLHDQHEELR